MREHGQNRTASDQAWADRGGKPKRPHALRYWTTRGGIRWKDGDVRWNDAEGRRG